MAAPAPATARFVLEACAPIAFFHDEEGAGNFEVSRGQNLARIEQCA